MSCAPWPWSRQGRYVFDAHENLVAAAQQDDGAFSLEEAKEHASLIAAAPELLEALKAVIAEYEEGYGLRCVEQVRAAIAKAEGK